MRDLDDVRTALYRLRDAPGRLLYVGIAFDPLTRWIQHARDKDWWEHVARFEVEWHESRSLAEAAEIKAIRDEKPEFNRAGVEGLRPGRPALATVIPDRDRHKTPRRQVAIDDTAWDLLGELVGENGRSALTRDLVAWYLREPGARLPKRPMAKEIEAALLAVEAMRAA